MGREGHKNFLLSFSKGFKRWCFPARSHGPANRGRLGPGSRTRATAAKAAHV